METELSTMIPNSLCTESDLHRLVLHLTIIQTKYVATLPMVSSEFCAMNNVCSKIISTTQRSAMHQPLDKEVGI